jgi:UDP-N-acetylmuramate--alanine ligase
MIAHVLTQAGMDPTYVVGGIIAGTGSNARSGSGPHFVIEADEYDGMFLGLKPTTAVITHLEADHPDCYPTLADMIDAFRRFLALVPEAGQIVACADEPNVRDLVATIEDIEVASYGLGDRVSWRAIELEPNRKGGTSFSILHRGSSWAEVELSIPGTHNVKNALGAAAACHLAGASREAVAAGLSSFSGVRRRFERKGVAGDITVIDDYAHHPTKIRATLAAARQQRPEGRIWAVFQPHTYSRTQALFDEFATSFQDADRVLVLDIYAAREHDDLGMHSSQLAEAMRRRGVNAPYCASFDQAVRALEEGAQAGDVVITLSAGDGYLVGERLLQALRERVGS